MSWYRCFIHSPSCVVNKAIVLEPSTSLAFISSFSRRVRLLFQTTPPLLNVNSFHYRLLYTNRFS